MEGKPICVVNICKGYCCEHISPEVAKGLALLLEFEPNGEGEFRCKFHNKETGICEIYDKRTAYCKEYFCPSATRGHMENALKYIDKPIISKCDKPR